MPTGLSKQVVDIFLSTLNQVPDKHSGPIGRLTNLVDCIVKKYVGPGQAGERTTVEAREAFQAIAETSSNVDGSGSVTLPWSTPQALGSLGRQLVSVSNEVPRVYAGTAPGWTGYPDVKVLSDKLSEEVYHTSDHTIQAPDAAQVGNSTGFVWTETAYTQTGLPVGSTWFAVKANDTEDGVWLTTPRQLFANTNSSLRALAKIVSDGSRFWVFWNDVFSGTKRILCAVFNEQGVQQDVVVNTQNWGDTPGYWDVAYQGRSVLLAQPSVSSGPGNGGVVLTKFSFSGVITSTSHTDLTMLCNSGVAFLTNDLGGPNAYLATIGQGLSPSQFHIYAWRVPVSALAQDHEYDTGVDALPYVPDSVTGWTVGSGNLDVNVVYSLLSMTAQTQGPVHDPALRSMTTVNVTFSGTASFVRTTQSVIAVSRAFQRDGAYYVYSYYQSGSGSVLTNSTTPVTVTLGDYMLGNGTQPVNVVPSDYVTGGSVTGFGNGTNYTTLSVASSSILGSDSFAAYAVVASDTPNKFGVPVGANVLRWDMSALHGLGLGQLLLAQLVISGSGIANADGTYLILASDSTYVFTKTVSDQGFMPAPATFPGTGTVEAKSTAVYVAPSLSTQITVDQAEVYVPGGTVGISGSSVSSMNGNFNVQYVMLDQTVDVNTPYWANSFYGATIVCLKTSQSSAGSHGFNYSLNAFSPYTWFFAKLFADNSYIGSAMTVSGANGPNNGVFAITGLSFGGVVTGGTDATATIAQFFKTPLPDVSVNLPLSVTPYTFYVQSITTDYTWTGGQIQVLNAKHPSNNGVYTITWLDPSDPHKFVAIPSNGKTDQVNESFEPDSTISIALLKANQVAPEFQPVWFITPLDGKQPQVGCLERGLAYADWRFEGEAPPNGPNTYQLDLSSPFISDGLPSVILPYRAKSFTAGQTASTPSGTATSIVVDTEESTIGLKRFRLDTSEGQSVEAFNELLMAGPLATGFTSSGFHEQGINLGPEQPWLVSESFDSGAIGISPGEIQVKVVYEWMDENGERGYSYPSPPLIYSMQSPNNTAVYGGRLPLPLDLNGKATIPGTYGITNRTVVGISLYRTATVNGVPSTQLYKFTNDLNVNGLYGGGSGSGFTFPDSYTWNYRDQSLDAAIVNQEALYTSKGLLPRYPAPPYSQGCVWENRTWLAGYDGAGWCSGDKTEGDGNWFFPGLRIPLMGDTWVASCAMEQYLVIGGTAKMWYIPAQSFPNNTGISGSFPTPAPLPFPNGCTGFMVTSHIGTVYSSTAGGVWCVTRDLKNLWLSEPVKDDLVSPVTGIAVDGNQRIAVTDGGSVLFVYDPIPATWYKWQLPSAVQKLSVWNGNFAYQDSFGVLRQVPGQYLDTYSGGNHPIEPDLTLAGISFARARAVKRVWEFQATGQYKGPHNVNIVLSYPDDTGYEPTTFGPSPADPNVPYEIAFNPANEEASQFQIQYVVSFENIPTPGNSMSLELLSAEVGVDRKQGLYKLPPGQRVSAN